MTHSSHFVQQVQVAASLFAYRYVRRYRPYSILPHDSLTRHFQELVVSSSLELVSAGRLKK
jgi:hypothetical protein